jgi:hypothetical protein
VSVEDAERFLRGIGVPDDVVDAARRDTDIRLNFRRAGRARAAYRSHEPQEGHMHQRPSVSIGCAAMLISLVVSLALLGAAVWVVVSAARLALGG